MSGSSQLSGRLVSQNYEYFHLEGGVGSPSKHGSFGWAGPHGRDGEIWSSGLPSSGRHLWSSNVRVAACSGAPPGCQASFLASVAQPFLLIQGNTRFLLPPRVFTMQYASAECMMREAAHRRQQQQQPARDLRLRGLEQRGVQVCEGQSRERLLCAFVNYFSFVSA